ncbi:MAG: hypothetical protein RIA63_13045, partial [Cyclobacteriaceae bacterium]
MQKRALTFLLVIPLIFQACSKKAIPIISGELSESLDIQEIDFEYFQGKARLNYNDGKKEREVKATIRVRKDSVI